MKLPSTISKQTHYIQYGNGRAGQSLSPEILLANGNRGGVYDLQYTQHHLALKQNLPCSSEKT